MSKNIDQKILQALVILEELGFPSAQKNDRSALCLLALLNVQPGMKWTQASDPLIGITPIMDWVRVHYRKDYAPNTRETFRRYSMHQFVQAGIARYNPDNPKRPVNSPKAVYQISQEALDLIHCFGTQDWSEGVSRFLSNLPGLSEQYAKERAQTRIPVRINEKLEISLTPGNHNYLIKSIIEEFGPRFIPDATLIYAGDTGAKYAYADKANIKLLGIDVDAHGKMPDVILYSESKKWLVIIEAVTSHGPVDGKRHLELLALFRGTHAGLVFVTAFPNRAAMSKYIGDIAWETEVWIADSPSHLIHFDGDKFLGPFATE